MKGKTLQHQPERGLLESCGWFGLSNDILEGRVPAQWLSHSSPENPGFLAYVRFLSEEIRNDRQVSLKGSFSIPRAAEGTGL